MSVPEIVLQFRAKRQAIVAAMETAMRDLPGRDTTSVDERLFRERVLEFRREMTGLNEQYAAKSPESFCECFPRKIDLIIAKLDGIMADFHEPIDGRYFLKFREAYSIIIARMGSICAKQWQDDLAARSRHFQINELDALWELRRGDPFGRRTKFFASLTNGIIEFFDSFKQFDCACPDNSSPST